LLRRAPLPGRAIAPSKGDHHDHDRAGVPRQRASMPVLGRVGERAGKQRRFLCPRRDLGGRRHLGREIDRRAGNRGNPRTFTPSGGCGLAVAAGPALCDESPAVWRCWRRSPRALALACVQEGSHRPPNPCIPVAVSTRRPHTDLLMLSVLDHMFPALTQWRPLVSCRDWRWYGESDAKGNAGQCQPTFYGS
jgi:hypothetical protein